MPGAPRPPGVLLECVPNVSEGRDRDRVHALAATVASTPGVRLMNVHMDADHHRAVLSFLGAPGAVETAALALAAAVIATVDLRVHRGRHPRIGALDVLPFVPLAGLVMDDAVATARRVGAAIAARHRLPVYYYGHAAMHERRRRLPELRHGEYERLAERLQTPEGQPDDGPARFDTRAGAVLVGARDVLIAYNVELQTLDLAAARAIAAAVRESGGGLPAVQAMGVALESRGRVQVSMNLLDFRTTPIPVVFDRVREEAARRRIEIAGAELVGVAPHAAFAGRSPESCGLHDFTDDLLLDTHVRATLASGCP